MSQRQIVSQVIGMDAMAIFARLREICASWGHAAWAPILAIPTQQQGMAILDRVGEPLRSTILALPDSVYSLAPGMLRGYLGRNVRNLVICAVARGQLPWWAGCQAGINPDRWAACWPGPAYTILRDLDAAGIVPCAASDYEMRCQIARREARDSILRDLACWSPHNPSSRPRGIRAVDRDESILDAIFADYIPANCEPMTVGVECELAWERPSCDCACDCEEYGCDCDLEDYCTCERLSDCVANVLASMRSKGWEVRHCYDGSIQPEGREFVSPPLPLDRAGAWLSDLLRAAYREGFRGNDSCGIHVHLGIQNLGVKKWAGGEEGREFWREFQTEFCRKLQEIEEAGTCWIPDCRQHSDYCRWPWERGEYMGNKYNALNIRTRFETVEIRRFGFEDGACLDRLANQTDEFQEILDQLCSQFGFLGQIETWDESQECQGMREKGIRQLRSIKDRILAEKQRIRDEQFDREMAPYRNWGSMMRDLACGIIDALQAQPGFGQAEQRVILDEMFAGIPRKLDLLGCTRILSQQNSVPSEWVMARWAQNLASFWANDPAQVRDVLDSAGSRIKNEWLGLAERMANQFSSANSQQIPCQVA